MTVVEDSVMFILATSPRPVDEELEPPTTPATVPGPTLSLETPPTNLSPATPPPPNTTPVTVTRSGSNFPDHGQRLGLGVGALLAAGNTGTVKATDLKEAHVGSRRVFDIVDTNAADGAQAGDRPTKKRRVFQASNPANRDVKVPARAQPPAPAPAFHRPVRQPRFPKVVSVPVKARKVIVNDDDGFPMNAIAVTIDLWKANRVLLRKAIIQSALLKDFLVTRPEGGSGSTYFTIPYDLADCGPTLWCDPSQEIP